MKKSLIILALNLLFSAAFGADRIKIAVMELDKKTSIDTGSLTEVLQAELARKKNVFVVVEREKLSQVIKEQKLSLSGITEEDAVRLGEILGAQLILSGTVSYIDGRYIITVKALNSTTGVVEWGDTVMSYDKSGVVDIMPTLAQRIALLAQGRKVATFKLKPIKKTPDHKRSGPGYFSTLMAPPGKDFAWEMGLTFGKFPGFSQSGFFGLVGGFHAPGESFLQAGLDLELGTGSLNTNADSQHIILSPVVGISLVRTKIIQVSAGLLYQFNIRKVKQNVAVTVNKLWFTHHNVGLYADANLMFGRNWSLSLGWKYSIPVKVNMDASGLSGGVQDQLGLSQIQDSAGLGYHSITLNFNLYK